jgi:hypothetical protein
MQLTTMGYNQLIWDQKKHEFNWVGKKIEHDITWCYLEVEDINMFYKGIITNLIFVADYQDQLNITRFYKEKQMEMLMHHKDEISGTIFFNEGYTK